MVASIFSRNRRLEPVEAIKEGASTLRVDAQAALGYASGIERIPDFPSEEEKEKATESIGLTISCLRTALAAAERVQQNLKKM